MTGLNNRKVWLDGQVETATERMNKSYAAWLKAHNKYERYLKDGSYLTGKWKKISEGKRQEYQRCAIAADATVKEYLAFRDNTEGIV